MKTKNILFSLIILCMLFLNLIKVNAQWEIQTSGTNFSLSSVYFTDANTGYAVGDVGKILKTINGGINWTAQTSSASSTLYSVYFTDVNTGYVVGGSGKILKTINGGANWTNQTSGTTNYLFEVFFTDANIGYTVGSNGIILKSINGGSNWTAQSSGTTENLNSVYFTDSNIGYAVGLLTILKTVNGGVNWTSNPIGAYYNLRSVYFTDANTGYAVGDNGTILKTNNGGTNWTTQTSGTIKSLYSVYFINGTTGYAVGDNGTILKTINGGANWTAQSSGTTNILNSIFLTDANNGYSTGNSGTIIKTNTSGIPGQPSGETSFCHPSGTSQYTTTGATYATSYLWSLNPSTAGTITGTGTTATVTWSSTFNGSVLVMVQGVKSGYNSTASSLNISINNSAVNTGSFSLSSPINGVWSNTTPQFQWALAANTFTYSLYIDNVLKKDNIVGSSYQILPSEAISNGMHTWYVLANNGCSIQSTQSNETWSLRVDATQPTAFSLVSPVDNSWTTNLQPTLTWGASSDVNSGLAKYQLWIDGVLNRDNISTSAISTTPTTELTNGSHFWEIRAVDNVGNVRNSTQVWTVKIDNTPPTTTIDLDNFESGNFSNIMWTQGGNSSWTIDSSTKYEGNYSAKSGLISDNQTTDLKLNLNNISGTTISFYYKVSSEPNYDYLYFKENTIYYGIWSGEIGWTKASYNLAAGTNTYTWSYSKDGRVATGSDCAWIDKICMTSLCKLKTPLNQQYLSSKLPTFSWGSAPDSGIGFDKFQLFIDGNMVKDNLIDSTWTVTTPLTYGVHTWYVKGFDLLGNNQASIIKSFYIDNAKPNAFNLTTPTNNQIVNLPTPNLTWQATADSTGGSGLRKYQLLINGIVNRDSIPTTQTTVAPKNALAQGAYTWYIKAFDNVGNVRQSTQTNTFYVDWENPTDFTLISPLDNSILTIAKPEFKWHKSIDVGSGISKYELNITGQTPITILPTDTSKIITSNLPNGPYTWYVKAYDVAGGFTSSNTLTFTINANISGVEQTEMNNSIKVYPNPVGNELAIESDNNKRTDFEIINSIGQIVYKGILLNKIVVQTSGFNAGIYIVKLENGKTYEFKKILKK